VTTSALVDADDEDDHQADCEQQRHAQNDDVTYSVIVDDAVQTSTAVVW
jgi:hypothetical protein